jgi:3'-phosphoadenosine 5'-phosphosulfate (PAPS) 3'-phosphatase
MALELEVQVAEELARRAGAVALGLQKNGNVDYKPDGAGPVTEGDYAADQIIREGLFAHFPNDVVITEETFDFASEVPSQGRVWFIDPIDGTIEYVNGGDDYAVMIGLAIDGVPTVGVVFQPATGILWRGRDTRGSKTLASLAHSERVEANGDVVRLDVEGQEVSAQGPVVVISRNHSSQFLDFITHELPASRVIKKGSVGLKLAVIADGQADFYITSAKRIKLWDTCAPHAILSAAGGLVRSIKGAPLVFGHKINHGVEIYATTPQCHIWMQTRLFAAIEKWKRNTI